MNWTDIFFRQKGLSGVVAFASEQAYLAPLRRMQVPVLNIAPNLDSVPFPSVLTDEEAAGYQAAASLIASGADRIVYAEEDPDNSQTGYRHTRLAGAERACLEYGCEIAWVDLAWPSRIVDYVERMTIWVDKIAAYLDQSPGKVCMVAGSSNMGQAVLLASRVSGRVLGEDLVLIQIGSARESMNSDVEEISYVSHDWQELGRRAIEVLVDWVEDGKTPPDRQLIPPRPPVLKASSNASAGCDLATRVRAWLTRSDDYAVTVIELANRFDVSQATLYREWARSSHESLKRVLVERRIKRACELLKEQELAVTDVAVLCGYSDASNFTAAFRREQGLTPNAFRARLGTVKARSRVPALEA